MPSWTEVEQAAPELAAAVKGRFEAHGLAMLATLRRGGGPRLSGIEVTFALGELWLGMMEGSRKTADLRRDPRLALHAATADKEVTQGDAKLSGRAVEVTDPEVFAALAAAADPDGTPEESPEPYALFRVDVTELSTLRVAGDHLVIEWWKEGGEPQSVDRY